MNEYFALRFVFLTQYKVLNEMHLECKRQTKILVSGKKVKGEQQRKILATVS